MIIAQQKQKENIIEYIIYMWQVEGLIRSCEFNYYMVEDILISQYKIPANDLKAVKEWYKTLIKTMKNERLEKKGHTSDLTEIMAELNTLHSMLLNMFKDPAYEKLFLTAEPNIVALREKSNSPSISDIEVCLNGLYGVLSLKMRKKDVSEDTQKAIATFSGLLVFLAKKYHEMKNGKIDLPLAAQN